MKKPVPAPARLVELPPEHAWASLGVLVESVPQVPSEKLPLVKWRVRSTLRRRLEWRRRALRVAVVGSLLFLAGGVVGAVVQPALLSKLHAKLATSAEAPRPSHGTSARARRRGELPVQTEHPAYTATEPESAGAVTVLPPVAAEPRAPVASATPAPAGHATTDRLPPTEAPPRRALAANTPVDRSLRAPAPRATPAATATEKVATSPGAYLPLAPSALPASPPAFPSGFPAPPAPAPAPAPRASEQALLTRALHSLSVERNPARALALLDEHASRFGAGTLAPEAARLRTWALLLAGDRDGALAVLSRQSSGAGFEGLPGGEEYRVLRGELHARAGRWREALSELDLAVTACLAKETANGGVIDGATRSRLERALWGRASARSHLGDPAGAEADLREYLRRFPQGRFAVPAARLWKGGR